MCVLLFIHLTTILFIAHLNVLKVWVTESFLGRDSLWRLQLHHLVQEVYSDVVKVNTHFLKTLVWAINFPLGEGGLEVWQVWDTLPGLIGWCAHYFKYFEDLSYFWITIEERSFVSHLEKDATHGPHVNCCAVYFLPKKDLRGSIPKRYDLVRIWFEREAKGSCQTKICQLYMLALRVY